MSAGSVRLFEGGTPGPAKIGSHQADPRTPDRPNLREVGWSDFAGEHPLDHGASSSQNTLPNDGAFNCGDCVTEHNMPPQHVNSNSEPWLASFDNRRNTDSYDSGSSSQGHCLSDRLPHEDSIQSSSHCDGDVDMHPPEVAGSINADVDNDEHDQQTRIRNSYVDDAEEQPITFENVVITNVDGSLSSTQMRAAAIRHVRHHKGAHVEIPCGSNPVSEYCNPTLLPMIYPTLFPYGLGGCDDGSRSISVSMKRHVKHLLRLEDRRFQEHPTFAFVAFSILQKRSINLHTSLRVKANHFENFAASLASVPDHVVEEICRKAANEKHFKPVSDDEKKMAQLMNEVNVITSHVPLSSAAKIVQRNEIKGLILKYGLPAFYVTLNPVDIYNPLVKFLAGSDIDIDQLLDIDIPNYAEQSTLVAKNPFVPTEFFDRYMNAFCTAVLSYADNATATKPGVLGHTNAYYGCVEAQGRRSLHCHMLIWIAGSYNVDEMRDRIKHDPEFTARVIRYMDDIISTSVPERSPHISVPSDNVHPSTLRGLNGVVYPGSEVKDAVTADIANVVNKSQRHKHTATCYKYYNGPSDKKECRFNLSQHIEQLNSHFDADTGDLMLRHLDGLVNNFNETIIRCIRSNMDIKYMGSGPSTKAVMFYITDYITKTQLKSHVAFAALELAVQKLGRESNTDDAPEAKAKRLLQKCAFGMISKQELSAQQVASYLLDYGDHYTSHKYKQLYWTTAENYVDDIYPLLEDTARKDDNCSSSENDDNSEAEEPDSQLMFNDYDVQTVGITFSTNGAVHRKPTQIEQYLHRGDELTPLSLWQYIESIEKVNSEKKDNGKEAYCKGEKKELCSSPENILQLLRNNDHTRPKFAYSENHCEYDTHVQQIVKHSNTPVIVPIGPSMPRADRSDSANRYFRLMLILFKPWKRCVDLRGTDSTWESAYHSYFTANTYSTRIMKNMQLLNDCKDSRDDHFNDRAKHRSFTSRSGNSTKDPDCSIADGMEDDDFLEHLVSTTSQSAAHISAQSQNINSCLLNALAGNVVGSLYENIYDTTSMESLHVDVTGSDLTLEKVWQKQYKDHKAEWKQKLMDDNLHIDANSSNDSADVVPAPVIASNMTNNNISDTCRAPEINTTMDTENGSDFSTGDDRFHYFANKFKLNVKQRLAFDLVVTGCSGTGKSRVIKALSSYFNDTGQSRRLRLTAFTGAAAKNISGTTLHSSLMLDVKRSQTSIRELVSIWEGVDYLFIDEVSMIGCSLLRKIHLALCTAKESSAPFGGINIIFAGDFAQLPPVKDTKLYGSVKHLKSSTSKAQERVDAVLLWLMVDKVVILDEIMRQTSDDAGKFVRLLSRLREGRCNFADYTDLMTRVVHNNPIDVTDPAWRNTPVIVSSNVVKDKLNEQMTVDYATKTNQAIQKYYCKDERLGKHVTHPSTTEKLRALDSGQCNQRLGVISMVIGMPVVLTQNLDAPRGIVNGSIGNLRSVRYSTEDNGDRVIVSCVVNFPGSDSNDMSSVSGCDYPVVADTVNVQLTHDYSKKKITFRRTQVPIAPAFAFTAHKVQGQSFPSVVVDLQDCRGVEQPYVMISRVSSFKYLRILRPFDMNKICCNPSEDRRAEFHRLSQIQEKASTDHVIDTTNHPVGPSSLQLSIGSQMNLIKRTYGQGSNGENSDTIQSDPGTTRPTKRRRLNN